jgi:arginyl-tRNA synthetase
LGKDWEALVEELLVRVKELASQQADILRMIESYISELGKRVTLRELSLDLEKEMATERTAQLKTMEVEVEKLWTAFRGGNMASITQGYKALKDQLDKYI